LLDEHQVHDHVPDQHHEGGHHQPVVDADEGGLAVAGKEAQGDKDAGKDGESDGHILHVFPLILR
jgi:hypothetical protein